MTKYYKWLFADMLHNGFQYKVGLNIDTQPFNPSGRCEPGGLYYTDELNVFSWMRDCWPYIADVTVPADANVYPEPDGTKWKADRIVISNIRTFEQFLNEQSDATLITLVSYYNIFPDIRNPSFAVTAAALHRSWTAIAYVKNLTPEVCRLAVRKHGCALRYVPAELQTPEMCAEAIDSCQCAADYVKIQI